MSCCPCYIVPPQLLQAIQDSSHNSDTIRNRAKSCLESRHRCSSARKDRIDHLVQPDPGYAPTHHPRPFIPQQLLERLSESQDVDEKTRSRAKRDKEHFQKVLARGGQQDDDESSPKDAPYVAVYDMKQSDNEDQLPGFLVRAEGEGKVEDQAVNEAFDNVGTVLKFYKDLFNWNSIDNKNMDVISSVHFGQEFENAYWDPQHRQMVFGDGGDFLYNFTGTLDVIGHELTHAVTEHTSPLVYWFQSGALNEHISDVFGIMVKQLVENENAENADWLIGEGCLLPGVKGVALRSMKDPGTAYNDNRFGKDPQVGNFRDFRQTEEDNGGVHIYSGIPNRAFYLAAKGFGGFSWEKAGQIWWSTLRSGRIPPRCTFQQFADVTVDVAKELFDTDAAKVVREAWVGVGVSRDV